MERRTYDSSQFLEKEMKVKVLVHSSWVFDVPPKLELVAVRESCRAEGPERILSDVAEQCGSDHLQVASCG